MCMFLSVSIFSQVDTINIIPKPQSMKLLNGSFAFGPTTKIVATDDPGRRSAAALNDILEKNYGFKLETTNKPQKKDAIVFATATQAHPEGYGLTVEKRLIKITGDERGMFYGIQSLMQLIPIKLETKTKIPAVEISDAPRFGYRGMHLDVGRHVMPVSFIKKYIDLMSQYKFNSFHWHLTEDQGWRIEIKKYPRLTEVGSIRKESRQGRHTPKYVGDGTPYGGFYTQDEARDVVAYAKSKHITVIPEIELPGHSVAALAAYPNLGCKENATYEVFTDWGITKDIYCPKEETFAFLEDVLTEVIGLFPDSPYIHIGGDEAPKDVWKASQFVQDLKQREGLKDEHEVQSYFIRRIEKFINSKGKRLIGWDEILEGGLAPNATVMSWRGEKGGIEAAKHGNDVIMTPTDTMYFDYGQGDPKFEPLHIGGYLPLKTVYSYNPQPKELNDEEKKHILGAQGNVWTEYMKTPDKVEYMALPRMLALSEVVWSPLEQKDYDDFLKRLSFNFPRLDKQNVNYRIPEPLGLQNALVTDSDKARVELKILTPGSRIFYTLDGSEPTTASTEYKQPFDVTLAQNEKKELRIIVELPTGRKSVVYTATFWRRAAIAPVELKDKKDGVNFSFFKGEFKSVKDMDQASPTETGESKSIDLKPFAQKVDPKAPFGVAFDGYIYAPNDGVYEFAVDSDDGAILYLGNEAIADNDGAHERKTVSGIVPLKKGYHPVRLKYFQAGGDMALTVRFGVRGTLLRGPIFVH